jgi:hypothetical protein
MNNHQWKELSSAERFHALMEELGFKKCLSPAVLAAAMCLRKDHLPGADWLNRARHFFCQKAVFVPLGLEEVPPIWLSRLPDIIWATRKPEWTSLPYFIRIVGIESGILRIGFPQEQWVLGDRLTQWDQLRIGVNLALRPNYWRPLSIEDEREIWDKRPDLRQELLSVS